MKNTKVNWGRTLIALMAVTVMLSMLLTACAPAGPEQSGGAGGGGKSSSSSSSKSSKSQGGGNSSSSKSQGGGNTSSSSSSSGAASSSSTSSSSTKNDVRGSKSAPEDPCLADGALPCGNGDHGKGNPLNGSLHANCRAAQGEVDPICTTPTPEPPTTETPIVNCVANCTPPPSVPHAPPPAAGCPNWIVFHTFRTGNLQVFRLDGVEGAQGANLIDLSNSSAMDSRPSRSPNDAMVVFQSNRNGNVELYLTDSEGKAQSRLTTTQSNNVNSMFGPDNASVIYQSDRSGNWDIYLLNTTTGVDKQLTSNTADDINPYWSPSSDWIVFQSNRSGTWNVYLLNVTTGTEYTVTDRPYDIVFPTWSPNGKQISFLADWGGNWDLYVSNIDGTGVKRLTDSGSAGNATWSPDGDRIAYQVGAGDNTDVFTYDLKSNKLYQLTDFAGPDSAPTWDCGGGNISFTSTRTGNPDIFSVPWTGGTISYITNNPATDKWSEWSPSKEPGSHGF